MRKIGPVEATGEAWGDVFQPFDGTVIAQVALASSSQVAQAVANAQAAQPKWASVNPQRRARILRQFLSLVEAEMDSLAETLAREHGKTLADAKGDIQRGLEVVEVSLGVPHLAKGEFTADAGPGIDTYSIRQPLGVVAGITPFNFPAMIPLWMAGPAIACGNAFILKPSERDPSVPMRLAELFIEAGGPTGIFNVINGDKQAVDALLDHPDIKAISFVGSTPIAQYIYGRAGASGKRVQALGGAKNHMLIMPDADLDQAVDALIGAAYGSAGERCMAISVAVAVGDAVADALAAKLTAKIATLKIGAGTDKGLDMGPLVTKDAQQKVISYIDSGVAQGAKLLVDGRNLQVNGCEQGFFVGGTLFDFVTSEMTIYQEEIFGPVLCIVRVQSLEDAMRLIDEHEYGNGTCIFTRDGEAAHLFCDAIEVGMVGVNVPLPVPVAYHSFGGWKNSLFGDLAAYGPDGVRFYTKRKTITMRWPARKTHEAAQFVFPSNASN